MTTRKKAADPVPPPPTPPLIRISISGEDMARLVDYIQEWDDPLAHRLRMRYSQHRRKFP